MNNDGPCSSLISAFSPEQALEDGLLVDVSPAAGRHGFRCPVYLTAAAYARTVQWGPEQQAAHPRCPQTQEQRLSALLAAAIGAVARALSRDSARFELSCASPSLGPQHELVYLKIELSANAAGRRHMAISMSDED